MTSSAGNEEFDRALSELLVDVDALLKLLHRSDEKVWAPKFEQAEGYLSNNDARAFELILDSYGGMGSFNDLLLSPSNNHKIRSEDVAVVNRELDYLRSRIWSNASLLRETLER